MQCMHKLYCKYAKTQNTKLIFNYHCNQLHRHHNFCSTNELNPKYKFPDF